MIIKMLVRKFKAQYLVGLKMIKKFGQTNSTKSGESIVEMASMTNEKEGKSVLSPFCAMKGTGKLKGDIVKSIDEKWDIDKK